MIDIFESLSDKLQDIIAKTSGQKELTQENMQDALREIRRALLDADVNLRVVKSFISNIKDRAEGENVIQGVNPSQQLIKIVHDELIEILGKEAKPLDFSGHPNLIMMLGLQGSGKTTSSAKLAVKLKNEGRNPLLVACDVYRPAAITQLKTLGEEIGVTVYTEEGVNNVQSIVSNAINYAKENNFNTLILDTAGRLQIDTEMMAELLLIDRVFHPAEKLLVIDSMSGQDSVNVANAFNEKVQITGMVMTKLDSDARGGAALSIKYLTGIPIQYITTGEKVDDIEVFHPDRMADRIIGMGDILTLVENVQDKIDEKEAEKQAKNMMQGKFVLEDMLAQMEQINKMGSIAKLMKFIPGMPKISKDDLQKGEKELKRVKVVIQSMTIEERRHPEILKASRKIRIAKGCAMEVSDVNYVLKKYDQMKQMMKQMKQQMGRFGRPM